MDVGFALTRHCNLRCPHCIRDDVTDVQSLEPGLLALILDQATALYDTVRVSFTGGEPLIHPDFESVIAAVAERDLPYGFTTNGWHMKRALPILERHLPRKVHLSLSGATREVHDGDRGRGSWDRVMRAMALLASRRVPVCFSLIVDRRTRGQLRRAADLAEELGAAAVQYILPQPVPGSAARGTDLPPGEWLPVRREVEAIRSDRTDAFEVGLAYGAPFEGPETPCGTFRVERIYVDPDGRVAACCQLSEYGANETEVVADLHEVSLAEAHERYVDRLESQWAATRPDPDADNPLADFPCMRCAKANGKLEWLEQFPDSPWHGPATAEPAAEIDRLDKAGDESRSRAVAARSGGGRST